MAERIGNIIFFVGFYCLLAFFQSAAVGLSYIFINSCLSNGMPRLAVIVLEFLLVGLSLLMISLGIFVYVDAKTRR